MTGPRIFLKCECMPYADDGLYLFQIKRIIYKTNEIKQQ